jgi:hypothetical protein
VKDATRSFDLSGLGVRLRAVPSDVAGCLDAEWGGWRSPVNEPFLDLEVAEAAAPIPEGPSLGERLDARYASEAVRFESDQGAIDLDLGGRGEVTLRQGRTSHRHYGLLNLLAAAMGWRLSRGRGLALHAAAAVLEGRAFVLVGASGAGKSTWSRAVAAAGGSVLTDDLAFLDTAGPPAALSVPFRVRPFPAQPPGRWPVAAILLPRHDDPPSLAPASPLLLRARLAANALYVEPGYRARPDAGSPLARLGELPARELIYGPDPSFVPLLRAFDA